MLLLILLTLSTYRLSLLFHNENGPWDIFAKLRKLVGIEEKEIEYTDDYGSKMLLIEKTAQGFFATLFNCINCLSGWVSLLLVLVFVPTLSINVIVYWLGVWGMTHILFKLE